MQAMKDFFGLGWVGSLIGLAGLIVAFFSFRASRIGARPVFQLRSVRLISNEGQGLPAEVEILYKGSVIPRLIRTQIVLWNSGKALIRGSDIVGDDPPRFMFKPPGAILNATARPTRSTIKFAVHVPPNQPNELRCGFDYLDPGDGASIEIWHTTELASPTCLGSIRGVPAGILNWGRLGEAYSDVASHATIRVARALELLVIPMGMGFVVAGAFAHARPLQLFYVGLGLLYVATGLANIFQKRRVPRRLRPEGLQPTTRQ